MASWTRCLAAAWIILATLCSAGCRSAPKLESNQGLTILASAPTRSSVAGKDMFFDEEMRLTYAVVAGARAGESRSFTRQATEKHGATVAEELHGVRIEYLRLTGDGSVVMPAVVDHANNALTLFDPPMVVMPATLAHGEKFEARSSMRVVDADNPAREKERGSATRSIEYLGDRVVLTSFGEVTCHLFRVVFTADLRMADDVVTSSLYISPEIGLVASQWSEKLTVLGAISKETGEVSVLSKKP